MANETVLADIGHATDEVSDGISAALVDAIRMVPLIYKENLPGDSNIKLFRKAGSLTAATIAEVAGVSPQQYQETEITATATKTGLVSRLSVEAQTFSRSTNQQLMMAQGNAIGRDLDGDVVDLFDAFATTVTSTSIATVDDIFDCMFNINNSNGGTGTLLVAALGNKQINEIKKEIFSSGAAALAQPSLTTLLGDGLAENGFRGTLPGAAVYEVDTTLDTGGGDDKSLVFNPANTFAGMYSQGVQTRVRWVGDDDGAGGQGFYDEISSWVFGVVVEWNDLGGCTLSSDT